MILNSPIFHCPCCGTVVRQEAFRLSPSCCGREMVNAGEETLRDDFARELDLESPGLNKPRVAPRWSAQDAEHISA